MKKLTYESLVELERMARLVEQGDEADPYLLAAAPALAVTAVALWEQDQHSQQLLKSLVSELKRIKDGAERSQRELVELRRSLGRVL